MLGLSLASASFSTPVAAGIKARTRTTLWKAKHIDACQLKADGVTILRLSHLKVNLMYMNWKQVTQLHKNEGSAGKKVYDWIERVASLREEEDQHSANVKAMNRQVNLLSKQENAARQLQKAFRHDANTNCCR